MPVRALIQILAIDALVLGIPSIAQHIICGNDLINVGGNWIGANRDSTQCPRDPAVNQQNDEQNENLKRADHEISDEHSQCGIYNSGYISIMSRYERSVICVAAFMLQRSNIDSGGSGLFWAPDPDRFRQCLGANGFSPDEREKIISWHPASSANSPAIAAKWMIKNSSARLKLMQKCQKIGVKDGYYRPAWNFNDDVTSPGHPSSGPRQ